MDYLMRAHTQARRPSATVFLFQLTQFSGSRRRVCGNSYHLCIIALYSVARRKSGLMDPQCGLWTNGISSPLQGCQLLFCLNSRGG